MVLSPGTRLGRYEIRSPLGAGGMGEVYLAWDSQLERAVALKILPADVTSEQQRVRRFIQEAKAASALNHPNIITIHEIGQADSAHFIVTEFIDGESLRQRITRARMKLSEALDVIIQVASALAAAHTAGIVHRDIKPENIMLRLDGYIKVLDFGLAKLTERRSPAIDTEASTQELVGTDPGTVIGTALYMSPEQARGLAVDARADIWSIGVVAYEMVAGRAPFEGATKSDVIAAILEREPVPLGLYVGEVPAELERIATKALAKDREERYQGVKDLLIDLRHFKKRLDFEVELERSTQSELSGGAKATATSSRETVGAARATAISSNLSPTSLLSQYKRRFTKPRAIDSLAVLPLADDSADLNMEYLSDGITESIINSLSQLPKLRVMARSTMFRYKSRETDPQRVGRELGVSAVLTGRVLQVGNNLHVQAELVDVANGWQLWGERYNRKVADIFEVQEEIAREITEKLHLKLTGKEKKRLTKRYTENPEAYKSYLKGRFHWNKRTADGLKKAIEFFNRAIEIDPGYALAYAGLADTYILLSSYKVLPPQDCFARAKAMTTKALEIDDALAEAHTSLARELSYDWDWPAVEREFKRAIKLKPNYATAHQWYGDFLEKMGRFDEAIAEMKTAHELDPLSLIINTELGVVYYFARQYDQAIEQIQKALEMDPNFARARFRLGMVYEQQGMYREAIAEYQRAIDLSGGDPEIVALGYTYAVSGQRDEAQRILDELKELAKRRKVVSPYFIATIHTGLGEPDPAFEWLEKAFSYRDQWLVRLKVDPRMDSLRSDPRFTDLVRRIGLAP